LHFADPFRVVEYCWEENTDKYAFRISELIQKHKLKEQLPAAKSQTKASLKSRLEEAKQIARTNGPSKTDTKKDIER